MLHDLFAFLRLCRGSTFLPSLSAWRLIGAGTRFRFYSAVADAFIYGGIFDVALVCVCVCVCVCNLMCMPSMHVCVCVCVLAVADRSPANSAAVPTARIRAREQPITVRAFHAARAPHERPQLARGNHLGVKCRNI